MADRTEMEGVQGGRKMNLSTLTGKKVRVMIKRGDTLNSLTEKYECTEDELRSRIDRLFTIKGAAHDVWNQLVANGKKAKSSKSPVLDQEPEQEQTEEAIVSVDPDNTEALGIQQLRESEEEKSKIVLSLEKELSAIMRERYELRKQFQTLRKEIADLKRTYLKKYKSAEKLIQRDNDLDKRMSEVAATCQEEKAALEAIRGKIEEASKIVLSVYENGEIALFEGILANKLDDRGHEDLYNSLREREEAEDFRPRDLRVIARLIKIVSRISVPFDIIFENEEVESGYKVFK